MEEVEAWRNRPLQSFYPFAFVDCIYASLRTEYGVQQVVTPCVMLAYDVNGCKDVLWPLINETESKACLDARSSTSCGLAALRSGIPTMDGGADWRKAPRLYSRMPIRFSAASYTSSAIPSATSHASRSAFTKQRSPSYGAINVKQAHRIWRSSRPTGRLIQARSAAGKNFTRRAAL